MGHTLIMNSTFSERRYSSLVLQREILVYLLVRCLSFHAVLLTPNVFCLDWLYEAFLGVPKTAAPAQRDFLNAH